MDWLIILCAITAGYIFGSEFPRRMPRYRFGSYRNHKPVSTRIRYGGPR